MMINEEPAVTARRPNVTYVLMGHGPIAADLAAIGIAAIQQGGIMIDLGTQEALPKIVNGEIPQALARENPVLVIGASDRSFDSPATGLETSALLTMRDGTPCCIVVRTLAFLASIGYLGFPRIVDKIVHVIVLGRDDDRSARQDVLARFPNLSRENISFFPDSAGQAKEAADSIARVGYSAYTR